MYKHYKGLTPNDGSEAIVNPFGRVVYWRRSPEDPWQKVGHLKKQTLRLRVHVEKCILLKTMTKEELVLELI